MQKDMMVNDTYEVKRLCSRGPFCVKVPGSKSITNRALMLAAMSERRCELTGVLFSDDSRAFLDCLGRLGFELIIDEENERVVIQGTGGVIPNNAASVDVRSAGTAARFLTVMLALAGGDYEMNSSKQMAKRPMEPLLTILRDGGVEFEFLGEEGHFPFIMHSHDIHLSSVTVDTTVSSQFTSALLMAGTLLDAGLDINVTGSRTEGSYIKMTLSMLEQFGISYTRHDGGYRVAGHQSYGLGSYVVEPDISAASYFYSMAPILGCDVRVERVHRPSLQGDMKYVETLGTLGCVLEESKEGLWVKGSGVSSYHGITIDMNDFSDQTMTMAAVAVYADTPTSIYNVGHIRYQESDRMAAIINELTGMGIKCEEIPQYDGIRIFPGKPQPAEVETYEDHRIAMAMSLTGLGADGVVIKNPGCCRKTFENYFEVLDSLYTKADVDVILLDNDNTIMDFDECARRAVAISLEKAGIHAGKADTAVGFADRFLVHNTSMWQKLERREITRQELLDTRWQLFFEKEGIDYDGKAFEAIYRDELTKQHVLYEGALELLKYLSECYDVYIATNGITRTQTRRIAESGVGKYIKGCFISEQIGADKPSEKYFDACMNGIGIYDRSRVMIIGDSLTSDMKGGVQYGIKTCWLNRAGAVRPQGLHCDYVVKCYEDIERIL